VLHVVLGVILYIYTRVKKCNISYQNYHYPIYTPIS
jgi:hypothetical protein